MPLSLFVAVYSAEIIRIVLGRKWLEAAPLLMILSFDAFIRQAVGSSALVLITRGRSKTYLGLTVLHNATLILLMALGVRWGAKGIALADVATTWLLIAPRLYYSLKDSPITVGTFFSTIARPAAASIIMAIVVGFLYQALPSLGAPVVLLLASLIGVVVFLGAWVLMPGGKAELIGLVADLRLALQKKTSRATTLEPVAMAS
jgi:O-antigen/teichoic acid export membrane protein